jgi:hypothetical protein
MIDNEHHFRTMVQGIEVDVVLLPDAVRGWASARPFLPPLTPMQIRSLGKRAALVELERVAARPGERWRVILGAHASVRRIDDVAQHSP